MGAHHRDRPLGELRRQPVAGQGTELDGADLGGVLRDRADLPGR
jgi:hypothetical protein